MTGERPGEPGGTPKVSVVIPCYNREAYIAQTVESVLGQTWQNLELVVVDDGSTDRSMDVLRGYGDRIRVMTHPGGENSRSGGEKFSTRKDSTAHNVARESTTATPARSSLR